MASLSSHLVTQLDQVRREGLFKPERVLLSAQGPSVTVAQPAGVTWRIRTARHVRDAEGHCASALRRVATTLPIGRVSTTDVLGVGGPGPSEATSTCPPEQAATRNASSNAATAIRMPLGRPWHGDGSRLPAGRYTRHPSWLRG